MIKFVQYRYFMEVEGIIQLIKATQTAPSWVIQARETNNELNALVYGENFHELLINQIEKIEDNSRAVARRKYSIDTRDLFQRIMEPRNNVFAADGGSENWKEDINKKRVEAIKERLNSFKGGKSIEKYMAESYFQLSDIDPNGLIFLEYTTNGNGVEDVYPTYKSIQDIKDYHCKGQSVKWVLFEPVKVIEKGNTYKLHRFVDEEIDATIVERNGSFEVLEDETFANEFGEVPAVILSPIQKVGSKLRLSWLFYIQELAKKYARDVSIKTLYEFLQGFPKHWRYVMMCNLCHGTGQKDGETCKKCTGTGELKKGDVTDDIRLPVPTDKEQPVIAPNIAGFVSPDLDTLQHMEESRVSLEALIEYTMWGTQTVKQGNDSNETATGRYLDIQPLINKLHVFADSAEEVENILVGYVAKLVDGIGVDGDLYTKTYGRRFIIESPDVLLEKYNDARKSGTPITVLDKMLEEIISSKYKNDINMRSKMHKKSLVEPYVHYSIKEIFDIFGAEKAEKKTMFSYWWEKMADHNKKVEQLKEDYNSYFEENKSQTIEVEAE